MSKTYKGYELIKAIEEGEIKENTKIEVHWLGRIVTTITYSSRRLNWKEGEFTTGYLCDGNYYFKILEDEETIDIDEIEELEPAMNGNACIIDTKTWTLNQVIKAVKQLNKQINKLEERNDKSK